MRTIKNPDTGRNGVSDAQEDVVAFTFRSESAQEMAYWMTSNESRLPDSTSEPDDFTRSLLGRARRAVRRQIGQLQSASSGNAQKNFADIPRIAPEDAANSPVPVTPELCFESPAWNLEIRKEQRFLEKCLFLVRDFDDAVCAFRSAWLRSAIRQSDMSNGIRQLEGRLYYTLDRLIRRREGKNAGTHPQIRI